MQDIQTQAITTYQNNILFFQEKYPEIHQKISILSEAIEAGKYPQKYSLEYKNNAFDILDTQTNEYLYGETSSLEHAKQATQEINFKKNEGVIETFYNYQFTKEAIEYANQEDPTVSQYVLTAPIVQFSRDLISKEKTMMKKIYKFIFFGVGLGVHLTEIHKKIEAPMYFIIEDNLEIFRLSLFVTDYSLLGKKSELYFSIMKNRDRFKEDFEAFYHNSFIRNNYIKYSLFYPTYKRKIADIQSFLVTQSHLTYPQNKLLLKSTNVLHSIKESYKFFDITHHYKNTPFSEKPVVLVAAGPSLSKEISWLQKNAPYVTIVALFMTLPLLEKHNIKADIIFHVDENMDIIDKTIKKLENKEILKESFFFLAPSIQCSHFLKITKKENIYLFEDRTRYRFKKGALEAFSVGEVSYALSLLWDTQKLYLLGLDLALDPETKQTHADGHNSNNANTQQTLQNIDDSDSVSLRGTEISIRGNFRESVLTTPLFDMSRMMLDIFTERYKQQEQEVYNLSDGAYFTNTIPKRTADIDFTQLYPLKKATDPTIAAFFNKNADAILDKDEIEALHIRIKDALYKRSLIEEFSKKKAPTLSQFQTSFTNMATQLIAPASQEVHELSQIYVIYLENIGGYIGDFFNTSNLPNPKRNIKLFQKILVTQLLKIIDKYIEGLNEVEEILS